MIERKFSQKKRMERSTFSISGLTKNPQKESYFTALEIISFDLHSFLNNKPKPLLKRFRLVCSTLFNSLLSYLLLQVKITDLP